MIVNQLVISISLHFASLTKPCKNHKKDYWQLVYLAIESRFWRPNFLWSKWNYFSLAKTAGRSLVWLSDYVFLRKILYSKVKVLVAQFYPSLCNPMDPPVSSVLGIFHARILEWVAVPFSRGSSQCSGQTWVSCIIGRFFTSWATRKAQEYWSG